MSRPRPPGPGSVESFRGLSGHRSLGRLHCVAVGRDGPGRLGPTPAVWSLLGRPGPAVRRGELGGRVEACGVWRKNGLRPDWGRRRGVLGGGGVRVVEGPPRETEWAGGPREGPAQAAPGLTLRRSWWPSWECRKG